MELFGSIVELSLLEVDGSSGMFQRRQRPNAVLFFGLALSSRRGKSLSLVKAFELVNGGD